MWQTVVLWGAFLLVAQFHLGSTELLATNITANFCGMKDPDPEKTCVSIRLPWQEEPVYFCTEKEKIHYRNQCGSHPMHCSSHFSRDTLLIATPWDCCPIASVPDSCVNAQCPPKPFNRTCEEIPPNPNSPWDCCPKYFCDEMGGSKQECRYQQLKPGCTSPPEGKMNCVGFYDMHGCCTRYQCDGEGKPGMCPSQKDAMKYSGKASQVQGSMATMDDKMNMSSMSAPMMEMTTAMSSKKKRSVQMNEMHPPPPHNPDHGMSTDIKHKPMTHGPGEYGKLPGHMDSNGNFGGSNVIGSEKHSYSIAVDPHPGGMYAPVAARIACVGDFNCPGTMKCCSNDISAYSDGMALPRNNHPTHGYCVDPVMM